MTDNASETVQSADEDLRPNAPNLHPDATSQTDKKVTENKGLLGSVSLSDIPPTAVCRTGVETLDELMCQVATWPTMQLRTKFALEANTHKGMIDRCKSGKFTVDPGWHDFRAFLLSILPERGRRPTPDYTLDRIEPAIRRYGPGLCRWADKIGQTRNRSVQRHVLSADGKELLPLAVAAKAAGIPYKTLAKRVERGAAPANLLKPVDANPTGKRRPALPIDLTNAWPDGVSESGRALWAAPYSTFAAMHREIGPWVEPTRALFTAWVAADHVERQFTRLRRAYPDWREGQDWVDDDGVPTNRPPGITDHPAWLERARAERVEGAALLMLTKIQRRWLNDQALSDHWDHLRERIGMRKSYEPRCAFPSTLDPYAGMGRQQRNALYDRISDHPPSPLPKRAV